MTAGVDSGRRRRQRRIACGCVAATLVAALTGGALASGTARPPLTAEQIVDKNVAARGGIDAWRQINGMAWAGHLESADPTVPRLTFVLEQKRPNKTRFELSQIGQKTLRVFDGKRGWKVKPKRDGSIDAQPYTPQDLEFAKQAQGLDGPLIDHKAKGIAVELAGVEQVEGHKAYRLRVRLPSGDRHDVWVDAKTFLDLKYDRTSIGPTGVPVTVSVFYRNYQKVDGLELPSILEIGGGPSSPPARMVIEKFALNPPLEDTLFDKPSDHRRRRATVIDMQPNVDPRNAFAPARPSDGAAAPVPDPTPPLP
jgi:hypothetical protein